MTRFRKDGREKCQEIERKGRNGKKELNNKMKKRLKKEEEE